MASATSRTVLFLPGAGGDPAFWRGVGDRLPADWSMAYLSWPGLGDQPARPGVESLQDLIALAEKSLGDAPIDLVAQSMGGVIALELALRWPAKVRRLVLAATSGGLDVATLGATDWRPIYFDAFPRSARWIADQVRDLTPDLPRVGQPVLLLWGDADPISPVAVGERLAAVLPHATLRVVAGGDHGFASEQPEKVAPWIREFLEREA